MRLLHFLRKTNAFSPTKSPLLFYVLVVALALPITLSLMNSPQDIRQYAQTANPTLTVPSPVCGGSTNSICPTTTLTPGGQTTITPTTSPGSATNAPAPTLDPCENTAVSVQSHKEKHKNKSNGAVRGITNSILELLINLLNMILKLLGGQPITLPTNPGTPQPTSAPQPTIDPSDPAPTTEVPSPLPTDIPSQPQPTTTPCNPTPEQPTSVPPTNIPPTEELQPTVTPATPTQIPTIVQPTTVPTTGAASTEAAARFNWGTPIWRDEFNYTGSPDAAKWNTYSGPGHAGKGIRSPSQNIVNGSALQITGLSNGTTGGISSTNRGTTYGRWEARMRVNNRDTEYHPVLIIWPDAQRITANNCPEIDYAESTSDTSVIGFYLHYNCANQQVITKKTIDLTQWHNFAVEWRANQIIGYIDGEQWFKTTNTVQIPDVPMHQTIQLDWFPDGTSTTQSWMQVDWIRQYK